MLVFQIEQLNYVVPKTFTLSECMYIVGHDGLEKYIKYLAVELMYLPCVFSFVIQTRIMQGRNGLMRQSDNVALIPVQF